MKNIYQIDIDELLEHSLERIKSLNTSTKISKVEVKNILENLRSSLEYTAQYINSSLSQKKQKLYFPYAITEKDFLNSINRNLTNLKNENSRIYNLIESLQPFKCNEFWLIDLCNATNIAKHSKALDIENQSTIEKKIIGIMSDGAKLIGGSLSNADITFSGNYINGKRMDDVHIGNSEITVLKKGEVSVEFNFEIVENKKIIIKDVQQDLLPFLTKCHSKIHDFTKTIFED